MIIKLFKLAVRVVQYKDRVRLHLPSSCPVKALLKHVTEQLFLAPPGHRRQRIGANPRRPPKRGTHVRHPCSMLGLGQEQPCPHARQIDHTLLIKARGGA